MATNKNRAKTTAERAITNGVCFTNGVNELHRQNRFLEMSEMRGHQFETFRNLVFDLWDEDKAIVEYFRLLTKAPPPLQAQLEKEGLGILYSDKALEF